jgi:hypothetical protein
LTTQGGGSGGGSSSSSTPVEREPVAPATPVTPAKSNITLAPPVTVVGDKDAVITTVEIAAPTSGSGANSAVIKIDAASEKFISDIKVVEGKLVLTPETGFSGKKVVTVTITENGRDRIVQIPLTVLPEPVEKREFTPTSSSRTVIRWTESPNADAYTVYLNGKKICSTSSNSCAVRSVLGPDALVEIVANGGDRTISQRADAEFRQNSPILITRIASATITKATLSKVDTNALDKVIALIRNQGFTNIVISNITTTKKTEALASARIAAIKKYIDDKTGSTKLNFEVIPASSRTFFNSISVKG